MDADDDVEEAEEVGVDVAQEIAEAVPVTKENRASLEKRPSLTDPKCSRKDSVSENLKPVPELEPRTEPGADVRNAFRVEGAKFKNLCSILNIDSEAFGLNGKAVHLKKT